MKDCAEEVIATHTVYLCKTAAARTHKMCHLVYKCGLGSALNISCRYSQGLEAKLEFDKKRFGVGGWASVWEDVPSRTWTRCPSVGWYPRRAPLL